MDNMKNKYLVTWYKLDILLGYVDAENEEEAIKLSKDEESAEDFPWLIVPTAEFVQVSVRAEEDG